MNSPISPAVFEEIESDVAARLAAVSGAESIDELNDQIRRLEETLFCLGLLRSNRAGTEAERVTLEHTLKTNLLDIGEDLCQWLDSMDPSEVENETDFPEGAIPA